MKLKPGKFAEPVGAIRARLDDAVWSVRSQGREVLAELEPATSA